MPGGLPSQVIEPAAQASPRWVQDVVNAGGTIWSEYPITGAAASVWIQVGIGVWLLVAPRGRWSRAAGLDSVAWGLAVWGLGESFGGIFAPGLSWLTGAPGAVLLYCVAGPRLLAGHRARPAGDPGRYDRRHGADLRAARAVGHGLRVRRLRRRARLRGEPVRGDRAGGNRRAAADGAAPADPRRGDRRRRAVPSRLGPGPGLWLPRRPGHRSEQHDPDDHPPGGRLPCPHPAPGRGPVDCGGPDRVRRRGPGRVRRRRTGRRARRR